MICLKWTTMGKVSLRLLRIEPSLWAKTCESEPISEGTKRMSKSRIFGLPKSRNELSNCFVAHPNRRRQTIRNQLNHLDQTSRGVQLYSSCIICRHVDLGIKAALSCRVSRYPVVIRFRTRRLTCIIELDHPNCLWGKSCHSSRLIVKLKKSLWNSWISVSNSWISQSQIHESQSEISPMQMPKRLKEQA